MKIKGAIFDLDGTLLETESYQWKGWVEALKPYKAGLKREEYRKYAGKSGKIIAKELVKKHELKVDPVALWDEKEKFIKRWFATEPLRHLHHAKDALAFFKSKGLKVALASSGSAHEIEVKLKRAGLKEMFDAVASRDEVKLSKPNPEIYLLASRKIGCKPEECIAFEDTQSGVESAKGAGIVCYAVPNEFSDSQDFSKADAVFRDLEKAIGFLKKKHLL
jgi:HAD superfamily hydrolase (TIGR01509 family)